MWFYEVEEVKKSMYFMALQGADRRILPFPDSISEAAHGGTGFSC